LPLIMPDVNGFDVIEYIKSEEGIPEQALRSFPINEVWANISKEIPPRDDDIEVAVKRLGLEGKILVSCGHLAAPSWDDALEILRIVKIALDLQKQKS